MKRSTGRILAALCCLALTGGCGGKQTGETGALTARAEGEPEEAEQQERPEKQEGQTEKPEGQTERQEP